MLGLLGILLILTGYFAGWLVGLLVTGGVFGFTLLWRFPGSFLWNNIGILLAKREEDETK